MYEFSVYGIKFEHEDNWQIRIDPIKSFNAGSGSVKAEVINTENHTAQASMRITWDEASEGTDGFAENYCDQLEKQYKKTVKNSKRYKILSRELVEHNGHRACFSHTALNSSTHFIRPIGKNVDIEIIELAFYCEASHRIVVATLSSEMEYYKSHEDELKRMLFSVRCH